MTGWRFIPSRGSYLQKKKELPPGLEPATLMPMGSSPPGHFIHSRTGWCWTTRAVRSRFSRISYGSSLNLHHRDGYLSHTRQTRLHGYTILCLHIKPLLRHSSCNATAMVWPENKIHLVCVASYTRCDRCDLPTANQAMIHSALYDCSITSQNTNWLILSGFLRICYYCS